MTVNPLKRALDQHTVKRFVRLSLSNEVAVGEQLIKFLQEPRQIFALRLTVASCALGGDQLALGSDRLLQLAQPAARQRAI